MNQQLPKLTIRGKEKLLFVGIYLLSVALILVLFSSFFDGGAVRASNPAAAKMGEGNSGEPALETQLLEELSGLQRTFLTAMASADSAAAHRLAAEKQTAFLASLDRVRRQASASSGSAAASTSQLLNRLQQAATEQYGLVVQNLTTRVGPANGDGEASSAQVDTLTDLLAKREARIRELEQQAAQLPRQSTASSADAANNEALAWRQRYEKLKAGSDKTAAQLNALRVSYKDVVDDNRRLIGQLQSIRNGKN